MPILESSDYNIIIDDAAKQLGLFLKDHHYSKIGILVDENTRAACLPLIHSIPELQDETVIEIHSGEDYKTIQTCEQIWNRMLMAGFDRHSLLINLGGGVIGDMGGFCAATFVRGIDFVQIPTTLLAQVDASVGGKLAVDVSFYKNMVGLFQNPNLVLIDRRFLNSLNTRELRSGYAEMVKHALIADQELWTQLQDFQLKAESVSDDLLFRSVTIKKEIVAKDPKEQNIRKILNFGHTVGHGVETQSWNEGEPLKHGEAIFVGMICEVYISFLKEKINKQTLDKIVEYMKKQFYKKNAVSEGRKIIEIMLRDKKNIQNQIRMSLIDGIGTCQYDIPVSSEEMLQSFSFYQQL